MVKRPPRPVFVGSTLAAAQAWTRAHAPDGVDCPCCGQFYKVYKRKLNSTMALCLTLIYQYFRQNPQALWLHVPAFLVNVKRDSTIAGGDPVKLCYWGLIDRKVDERADGSDRVGYYRITDTGKQFVEGKITVASHAFVCNQMVLGFTNEKVTIQEALNSGGFDYSELMGS